MVVFKDCSIRNRSTIFHSDFIVYKKAFPFLFKKKS